MDIRLFGSNPIFYFNWDGRPKSEDRCIGHFIPQTRINIDVQSSGIIAYKHICKRFNPNRQDPKQRDDQFNPIKKRVQIHVHTLFFILIGYNIFIDLAPKRNLGRRQRNIGFLF